MEKAMEYRFTNTDAAKVTFDLTIGEISDLRDMLEAARKVGLEGVSSWALRRVIKALAEAQRQAAETLAYDAKLLAEKALKNDDL
jgi:hypothetical protein